MELVFPRYRYGALTGLSPPDETGLHGLPLLESLERSKICLTGLAGRLEEVCKANAKLRSLGGPSSGISGRS